MNKSLGIVGVGKIGLTLGANAIANGWEVVGYRRSAMDDFIAAGGHAAASPRDVAERCDVVLTCLPHGNDALTGCINGPDGLAAAGKDGLVVIETSTIPAEIKSSARDVLLASGGDMLDSPITGTPGMVTAGKGASYVSGDRGTYDRVAEVYTALNLAPTFVGDFGAGIALKNIAAMLVGIHIAASAEAMLYADQAGVDLVTMHEAIGKSVATSAMFEIRGGMMAHRDYPKSGGAKGFHGTMAVLNETADAMPGNFRLLNATRDMMEAAIEAGTATTEVAQLFEHLLHESRGA